MVWTVDSIIYSINPLTQERENRQIITLSADFLRRQIFIIILIILIIFGNSIIGGQGRYIIPGVYQGARCGLQMRVLDVVCDEEESCRLGRVTL